VFALVPLLAVAFAMLSVFPVFERWMDVVQTFIYSNFVPAAGEAVAKYLREFSTKAAQLTIWGMLFVLATALLMMATIERTFNDIWHVPRPRRRLHRLVGYWAVLTLGPVLLAAGLSLGASAGGFTPAKLAGSKSANSGSAVPLLAVASGAWVGSGACVGCGAVVGCGVEVGGMTDDCVGWAGAAGPQAEAEIVRSSATATEMT